jgi:hypothetical protein
MKKILVALSFVLLSVFAKAQITASTFNVPFYGNCNVLIYKPANVGATTKLPAFVFVPGNGEDGNNIELLYTYSPMGFIRGGWKPDFMVVAIQPLQIWPNHVIMHYALEYLKTLPNFDINRWYGTGLSGGAGCNYDYIMNEPAATYTPPKACIPMSLAIDAQCGSRFDGTDSLCGADLRFLPIPMWGFGGNSDVHGVVEQRYFQLLAARGADARFTLYQGDHCCWGNYYNPNYREMINGSMKNIYEWALQYPLTTTLPVVWGDFRYNQYVNSLEWFIETEVDVDHYEVEVSDDGVNYHSIATVAPKGNGNSSSEIKYTYSLN